MNNCKQDFEVASIECVETFLSELSLHFLGYSLCG